jgi:uncharacterized membrane protein (DUF4010 family)
VLQNGGGAAGAIPITGLWSLGVVEIDVVVVRNFLIALLIGALVGIEREKRKFAEHEVTFGGLRTFILFAETGAVAAWLSQHLNSPWVFIAAVVAVAAAVVTGYVLESRVKPDSLGLTTEIAAITVCLLGGAVMFGYAELAVALAILTSAVLAFKQPLHGAVQKLGTDDIYAGLKLLIATFIVLPLLPTAPVDPWQALNPSKLWLLVILISAMSLVGYVAVRWLGHARGTAITGATGGLVSSTAVTLSFARQSRTDTQPHAGEALAAGILIAWVVMFVRVVIIVAVVNATLLTRVLLPFSVMAVVTAILAAAFFWRARRHMETPGPAADVPLTNPFSLGAATRFGLLFAVVLLAVRLAQIYLPSEGQYVIAAIAGLTDVDAITLSMAEYGLQGGDAATAAGAITIASLSNTVLKCGLILALGSSSLRRRLLTATGAILVTGIASVLLTL